MTEMAWQSINPSLVAAANAYRRIHGAWPERARFAPAHFADTVTKADPDALVRLAGVMDLLVSRHEASPRVTVGGRHGELTYNNQIIEADWDGAAFERWVEDAAG